MVRPLTMVITANRMINMNILDPQCNPPDTVIWRRANQKTVGEIINETIPNSNIGKKSFLHFLSAFLMLCLLSLR